MFADLDVGAVKIGMLSRAAAIEAVAKGLARHRAKNIVLDPVMVATSGDALLARDAIDSAAPRADPARADGDAQSAGGRRAHRRFACAQRAEMEAQAREILSLGARDVLIKGGHGEGDESVDLLIGQGEVVRLSAKRIATKNTHGTGCTLSSAIAAGLAKGRDRRRRPCRRPRPMSPRRSRTPTNSRSATATGRCIISMSNGARP